jgi:hypothetical protein
MQLANHPVAFHATVVAEESVQHSEGDTPEICASSHAFSLVGIGGVNDYFL